MIAHKFSKVIIGIALVSTLILTSAIPFFASDDIDILDDYPFYALLSTSSTTSGSASYQYIKPYRDGNTFYFPVEPYQNSLNFNFYFVKAPQTLHSGTEVNSSFDPVSTYIPAGVDTKNWIPIHIDSFSIKATFFAEQFNGTSYSPVSNLTILKPYDSSDSNNTSSHAVFYGSNTSTILKNFSYPQSNPSEMFYYALDGGFDSSACTLAYRLFEYPSFNSPFAVRLRVVIDEFLINGSRIAEEQIITEVNSEMASIYQRLSDYSLNHLTDVSLSDAFNNIDYAADTLENTRFRAIFDSFYGYGIIPTLIVLSLSIAFLGYLLYGKSG